jgi:hypothetical protein
VICEKCGARLYVVSSRHSGSDRDYLRNRGLIALAIELVGWYTAEWVVRQRQCKCCGWSVKTIEIPTDDLRDGWTPKE